MLLLLFLHAFGFSLFTCSSFLFVLCHRFLCWPSISFQLTFLHSTIISKSLYLNTCPMHVAFVGWFIINHLLNLLYSVFAYSVHPLATSHLYGISCTESRTFTFPVFHFLSFSNDNLRIYNIHILGV